MHNPDWSWRSRRDLEQHSADWSWHIACVGKHRWLVVVAGVPQSTWFRRKDARACIGSFKEYQ